MSPFLKGFLISLSLITAIGAQNAFVIKNGVLQRYVFITALICCLLDFFLISIGVMGVGVVIEHSPWFFTLIQGAGVIFLLVYGSMALRQAFISDGIKTSDKDNNASLITVLLTLLAVSLLNPHAYLDAVILIGGIGANYQDIQKLFFIAGSCLASLIWFFSLSYGSRRFSHVLARPLPWRCLNAIIAIIMYGIGLSLLSSLILQVKS